VTELYDPFEPGRLRARSRAKALLARYNRSDDDEGGYRGSVLRELLGRVGPGASIEPPFFCRCREPGPSDSRSQPGRVASPLMRYSLS
jgi:hypothetical protein